MSCEDKVIRKSKTVRNTEMKKNSGSENCKKYGNEEEEWNSGSENCKTYGNKEEQWVRKL